MRPCFVGYTIANSLTQVDYSVHTSLLSASFPSLDMSLQNKQLLLPVHGTKAPSRMLTMAYRGIMGSSMMASCYDWPWI